MNAVEMANGMREREEEEEVMKEDRKEMCAGAVRKRETWSEVIRANRHARTAAEKKK